MNLFPLDLNNYIRNGKCILKKDPNENQSDKSKASKKFSLKRPKSKNPINNKNTTNKVEVSPQRK